MRIDKFLSNLKYGSRKEIKNLIKDEQVLCNDEIVLKENQIVNSNVDIIKVNNEIVFYKEEINLAINKPVGYLSANKDNMHKVVFELIKEPYQRFDLKIAGRLDLESSGLLILTTSGSLAHLITSPNSKLPKEYLATLKDVAKNLDILLEGLMIKDGNNNDYLARALFVEKIDDFHVKIVIDEGKFHQVRRMFRSINNEVLELKRIKIGKLSLGDLKPGEYKEFEKEELLWMILLC